ncbi:GTPase-activating protein [Physocladia obscura]|uniref:GTPase-activating protein n=1 Tax=Physocladia obscura TaxID=109957 RepID=A0AAD5SXI4_9FUNG|nr:GTPase-activating protein [Physocladia obscura]
MKNTKRLISRIFHEAGPINVFLGTVIAVSEAGLQPVRNVLLGQLIDNLTSSSEKPVELLAKQTVIACLSCAAAIFTIGSILSVIRAHFAEQISSLLLQKLFERTLASTSKLNDVNVSLADIAKIKSLLADNVLAIVKSVILFHVGFVIAIQTSVQLSCTIIISFPIVALVLSRMWVTVRKNDIKAHNSLEKASLLAKEILFAIETVLSFNMQGYQMSLYTARIQDYVRVQRDNSFHNGIGWGSYQGIMFSAFALSFWMGGRLVSSGLLTPGGVLICFTQLSVGITALGNIGSHYQALQESEFLLTRLLEVLDSSRDSEMNSTLAAKSVVQPGKIVGKIEFKNVCFSYPSNPTHKVLKNFNLTLLPETYTAIVAESGAGKSTIFALLLRFHIPTCGKILLDGVDIQVLDVDWLRAQFATVPQQTHLFETMTVYENLLLGYPDDNAGEIKIDIVWDALKMAYADSIVEKLPNGLWTAVGGAGGNGSGFSGGQKQRLGIARAFICGKAKKLLLLDEPTSALDAESERKVQNGLSIFTDKKTTLLITHRVQILQQNVTRIVVLSNGSVVEDGTHDELYNQKNSKYRELFEDYRIDDKASKFDDQKTVEMANGKVNSGDIIAKKIVFDRDCLSPPRPIDWKILWRFAQPYKGIVLMGIFGSLLEGLIFPAEGYLISSVVTSYNLPPEIQPQQTLKYTFGLVALAIFAFICCCLTGIGNGYSQALMIGDLRIKILSEIVQQNDLDFFDAPNHSVSHLENILLDSVKFLEPFPGNFVSSVGKAIVNLTVGLAVALWYSPKLTASAFVCGPLVFGLGKLQYNITSLFQKPYLKSFENHTLFILSTLSHTLTISTLSAAPKFQSIYKKLEADVKKRSNRDSLIILFATGGTYACTNLIKSGADRNNVVIALTTLTLSAVDAIGVVNGVFGGGVLQEASRRFWKVVDILKECESTLELNLVDTAMSFETDVALQFRNVNFEYPNRREVPVLDNYCLEVKAGSIFLMTGKSGSGKSTIIQLLQKLRSPSSGSVELFGKNIRLLNATSLRQKVVAVTQNYHLFSQSIIDNIRIGNANLGQTDIITACKIAHAHDFIEALPQGYQTIYGNNCNGSRAGDMFMLSEGQKQRLCLARALALNPRVLLLDEVTSGLDGETEFAVVHAIKKWAEEDSRRVIIVSTHSPQVWRETKAV